MTGFDYVVIGIVALSLLFGLWRGVVGEIIALVAWVLAIFVAVEFGAQVGAALFTGMSDPALRTLAGCVVIFVGVLVVMALFRMLVRSMVKALGLSVSDRILGMLFGLARGGNHPHDVVDQRVVDEVVRRDLLQAQQVAGVEDLLGLRRLDAHPVDDLALFLGRRVADVELEQEAVALRLGQGGQRRAVIHHAHALQVAGGEAKKITAVDGQPLA